MSVSKIKLKDMQSACRSVGSKVFKKIHLTLRSKFKESIVFIIQLNILFFKYNSEMEFNIFEDI